MPDKCVSHSYTAAHASDDLWAIDRELHGWHQQAARDAWVRVHNFIVAQLNAAPQGQVVEGAASPAQPAVAAPSMPPPGPSDGDKKDAERFRYLQDLKPIEAQQFFWNHVSRKQRVKAIDEHMRHAATTSPIEKEKP